MAVKMAYVAMSRPEYLLCFALQKNKIQNILDDPEQKRKVGEVMDCCCSLIF